MSVECWPDCWLKKMMIKVMIGSESDESELEKEDFWFDPGKTEEWGCLFVYNIFFTLILFRFGNYYNTLRTA